MLVILCDPMYRKAVYVKYILVAVNKLEFVSYIWNYSNFPQISL